MWVRGTPGARCLRNPPLSMFAEGPRPPRPPRRRRHAVWGAAAAIALVLHLLVLRGGEAVDALPDPALANPTPTPDIDRKLPTYRTVMPPAATLHYDMQRGMWSGSGDLVWRPAAERYELRLEGNVAGLHVLTETSTGPIDAHGLAPLRY